MLCNVCGKSDATIHLPVLINSQMLELHLCETCANEKEGGMKLQFSFNDLLAGLTDPLGAKPGERKESAKCPSCGMGYEELTKVGRLGCAECYRSFAKGLIPLIRRVQKGPQHLGKRPAAMPAFFSSASDLRGLRERLRKAIEREEFEEAARMRDEIKQFESQQKKASKKGDKNA